MSATASTTEEPQPNGDVVPESHEDSIHDGVRITKKRGEAIGPRANRMREQAPVGTAPWESLEPHEMPPLLQGLAPQYPFDEGISWRRQSERKVWRDAWKPYARELIAIVEHMRTAEGVTEEKANAYALIAQSIQHDIFQVLTENADIRDDWHSTRLGTRVTHSWLAYSATQLSAQQERLEEFLGNGRRRALGSSTLAKRQFGQNYPGDRFREILHYRPQDEVTNGTRGTYTTVMWILYAISMMTMVVLLTLAAYWLYYGGHPVYWRTPGHAGDSWTSGNNLFSWKIPSFSRPSFKSWIPSSWTSSSWTSPRATLRFPHSSGDSFAYDSAGTLHFKVSGTMKIYEATPPS